MESDITDELKKDNTVVDLDTSFLAVGHVDEFANVIPTKDPAPCNFAIFKGDPRKGVELLKTDTKNSKMPYENDRDLTASEILNSPDLLQLNEEVATIIDKNMKKLLPTLAEKTGCKNIKEISLPQMWDANGDALWPDVANSLILDDLAVVPETFNPVFNDYIKNEFSKIGVTAEFLDDRIYHFLKGDIHCGTNVIRACK